MRSRIEAASRRIASVTRKHYDAGNFEIDVLNDGPHLTVVIAGAPDTARLLSTLHVLGVESELGGDTRLLLDLRELASRFQRAELVDIGRETASSFRHLQRIAILVRTDQVTGIAERSARRNGVNLRVFDLEGLALSWLATVQ
jgi:hypothetical protein